MIETANPQPASPIEFACYLKTFFASQSDESARRLLVHEFLNYDSAPQYHEMFIEDGTAEAISEFRRSEQWKHDRPELPKTLVRVSLANPSDDELHRYVRTFREAGITLPVIYPYFPDDEKSDFKLKTIERILQLA